VKVHRLVVPIGDGELSTRFTMTPQPDGSRLRVEGGVDLRRVDFSRLLGAAGGVRGSGRLGGVGRFEGQGRSLAEMAASAEGGLTMAMVGGTLSAFLIDLSGLRLGRALLSSLGLPERERIECLVADFPLRRGTLTARTLVMETETALVTGSGTISLAEERLDLRIRTESKRLTIGLLPVPILVRGTLKEPSVGLEPAGAAARARGRGGAGRAPRAPGGAADDPVRHGR
jgi:AsmA family protein